MTFGELQAMDEEALRQEVIRLRGALLRIAALYRDAGTVEGAAVQMSTVATETLRAR